MALRRTAWSFHQIGYSTRRRGDIRSSSSPRGQPMKYRVLVAAALAVGTPAVARAQAVVFTDSFDGGPLAPSYNVNASNATAGYAAATFGFDYGTVGIPSAPNSVGGTTLGLKLEANKIVGGGVVGGITVSPT